MDKNENFVEACERAVKCYNSGLLSYREYQEMLGEVRTKFGLPAAAFERMVKDIEEPSVRGYATLRKDSRGILIDEIVIDEWNRVRPHLLRWANNHTNPFIKPEEVKKMFENDPRIWFNPERPKTPSYSELDATGKLFSGTPSANQAAHRFLINQVNLNLWEASRFFDWFCKKAPKEQLPGWHKIEIMVKLAKMYKAGTLEIVSDDEVYVVEELTLSELQNQYDIVITGSGVQNIVIKGRNDFIWYDYV